MLRFLSAIVRAVQTKKTLLDEIVGRTEEREEERKWCDSYEKVFAIFALELWLMAACGFMVTAVCLNQRSVGYWKIIPACEVKLRSCSGIKVGYRRESSCEVDRRTWPVEETERISNRRRRIEQGGRRGRAVEMRAKVQKVVVSGTIAGAARGNCRRNSSSAALAWKRYLEPLENS